MQLRKRRKKTLTFIGIILILPFIVASYDSERPEAKGLAAPKPATNPVLDQLVESYESQLINLFDSTRLAGASIAVVKDSTVLYTKGFGLRSIHLSDPVNENTVFRIGSVSKCFASTVTAILIEEGLLDWDDPVAWYVPEFELNPIEQTNCLTVRNVLSHTTGLPYHTYTNLIEEGMALDAMIGKLKDVQCDQLGEIYSYQNVAYSIIEKVLESATGKSYNELLEEKIFEPLGMNHSSSSYRHLLAEKDIAYPHLIRSGELKQISISDKYYNTAAAGGINTTAQDMAKFMLALVGNNQDVISDGSMAKLFTPTIAAPSKNRSYRIIGKEINSAYGLGWRILSYENDTIINHGGYVNGYRCEIAIIPREHVAVCVLSSSPGQFANESVPLFLKEYLNKREQIYAWEKAQQRKRKFKESIAHLVE